MEMKQIITATVAVILICLVAVPIINDGANSITKAENNTSYTFMLSSMEDNIVVELSNGSVLINGSAVTFGNYIPFIISDSFITATTGGSLRTFFGESAHSFTKMEFNNNVAKMSTSEGEVTEISYNKLWIYSTEGDYGLYKMGTNRTMYVTENTPYYAIVFNSFQSGIGYFYGVYEFENMTMKGAVIPAAYGSDLNTPATLATTVNIVPGFDESKNLEHSIFINNGLESMTATLDDKTIADASKSILAPISYEVVDTDNPTHIILTMIPVILIAALLIGIGFNISRRD